MNLGFALFCKNAECCVLGTLFSLDFFHDYRVERMFDKRYAIVLAFGMFVASIVWMGNVRNPVTSVTQIESPSILSEEINLVENGGFETGNFSPWINQDGTSYNQIVSDRVYSGSYALYMNSHLSSAPYEPVYQVFDMTYTLADAHHLSAFVYPTLVGPTCGEAGSDVLSMTINNTETSVLRYMYYEWSGYTYPGGAIGVNVTSKVMYLLFDMIPNQWNLLERDILSDYSAFFGDPSNASELVIVEMSLLSHSSNGDPGDFWIDDIRIGQEEEPTPPAFNYIENPDFETGNFSPWINEGNTSYNQIVDSNPYNGTYSLFLDSHYSSSPYEPVTQYFSINATLNENLTISAAIYPEKVGNTCGQAGDSALKIWFKNTDTGQYSHLAYEWSGYTFPGNDLNCNIAYVRFLLFDWTPLEWNFLNRSVYDDYVSFFGVPTNISQIEFYKITLVAHSSNGDPGDFYADTLFLGNGSIEYIEKPVTTSTTTTTTTTTPPDTSTTTTEPSTTTTTDTSTTTTPTSSTSTITTTTPPDTSTTTSSSSSITGTTITTNSTDVFLGWISIVISGASGGVIIIIVIIIILDRRGSSSPSDYQW